MDSITDSSAAIQNLVNQLYQTNQTIFQLKEENKNIRNKYEELLVKYNNDLSDRQKVIEDQNRKLLGSDEKLRIKVDNKGENKKLQDKITILEGEITILRKDNNDLKDRITILEEENKVLREDIKYLKHETNFIKIEREISHKKLILRELALQLERKICECLGPEDDYTINNVDKVINYIKNDARRTVTWNKINEILDWKNTREVFRNMKKCRIPCLFKPPFTHPTKTIDESNINKK